MLKFTISILFTITAGIVSPNDRPLEDDEQELIQYLQRDLGDYFYLAVSYDHSSTQTLYVSSTAEDKSLNLYALASQFRNEEAHLSESQSAALGTYRCSLRLYEEWLLLHFQEHNSGIIVGVDAQSASHLRDFLEDLSPVVSPVL